MLAKASGTTAKPSWSFLFVVFNVRKIIVIVILAVLANVVVFLRKVFVIFIGVVLHGAVIVLRVVFLASFV